MSKSAVACVRHVMDEYRRFLKSTYRLADPDLRGQFEEHINRTDVLVKGPYVTLAREFARGEILRRLIETEVRHRDLARLDWAFGDAPLFRHQEQAVRLVEQQTHNCIVKTGTGSGKTEAFLLPVLSGILRLREQGVTGTKAVLLYPMNALANDQLERLRRMLHDGGAAVKVISHRGDEAMKVFRVQAGIYTKFIRLYLKSVMTGYKRMIYSPAHGDMAFTVPLFDEFMIRAIPDFKP